ncbi:MAG TPA: SusE domain-containing protein [Puia sp.]|nr:SusE domain-containing protein [Puia sp.]
MKHLIIVAMGLLSLTACKKDEQRAVLKEGSFTASGAAGLVASSTTLTLDSTNAANTQALSFTWPAVNFNTPVAVTYTLQIDSANGNFAKPQTVTLVNGLSKSYTVADFNALLITLGLVPGVTGQVEARVKADVLQSTGVASTAASVYSNVVNLTVTPYKIIIIYPKLYAAGDFLNPTWTPINQPGWILASVKSDGTYEGYINFPNANNNFKLCNVPSWNGISYGWGTSATTMSPTGGNLYFAGPAYCKVVADVNALTISYTKTAWTVSGDFNSWSTSATPMTFDPTTNKWTATGVSLTAGGNLKFVGDAAWATNFGIDAKGNLAYNGGNIPVTTTGVYTVTLDLSGAAGSYTYSIK